MAAQPSPCLCLTRRGYRSSVPLAGTRSLVVIVSVVIVFVVIVIDYHDHEGVELGTVLAYRQTEVECMDY